MNRWSSLLALLWAASALCAWGCGDTLGRVGTYDFTQDVTQDSGAQKRGLLDEDDPEEATTDDMEAEQEQLEDPGALAALISQRLAELDSQKTPSEQGLEARRIGELAPDRCLAQLKEMDLSHVRPSFETPLVESPLLLRGGQVGDVQVVPRWSREPPINQVVDCRLALALFEMSRVAARHGIARLEYYSIYRPLAVPRGDCPSGKKGSRCRSAKKELALLEKNRGSQHRRALAIDIRWVVLKDGTRLDVLEDYDRRDGAPPCDYEAQWEKARLLQNLVCDVHDAGIFNVMLTPNANKAHHNHFHFALTPGADWHILR